MDETSVRRMGVLQQDSPSSSTRVTNPKPSPSDKRLLSVENATLTEVITIYEKLKKGRETRVSRNSRNLGSRRATCIPAVGEETIPIIPIFNVPAEKRGISMLDFNRYRMFRPSKYTYFSEKTNLLQSKYLSTLSPAFSILLQEKNYWLNICQPAEEDYTFLFNSYGVHDLTIQDIREGNTEEKLEVFEHYTFLSLRLIRENTNEPTTRNEDPDVDFNILLFKDFVITIHEKDWPSIRDILGFLNLLSTSSQTPLTPDWILFSVFIEMNQDAKYCMNVIEPEVNKIRIGNKSVDIMRRNFEMELHVYSISRFIKPKTRILSQLKVKCSKRIRPDVMKLLGDILTELKDQVKGIKQLEHVLERSQDTFLAITTSDRSIVSNEVNTYMKRISEIALVFLPIQVIGAFFGMNVQIPLQNTVYSDEIYFWIVSLISALIGLAVFKLRKRILSY